MRNSCISILRKTNSRANYLSERQEDYEEEFTAAIIEQETLDRLHAAIRQLPEKYQQLFNLNYEQGLSNAEAARLIGITIDGFTKRKAKMIALLRNKFKNDETMMVLITLLLT